MSPRVAFVSFRFGNTDGVSVVARTWMDAFSDFGFDVITVSGDTSSDRVVAGLNFSHNASASPHGLLLDEVEAALDDVDLVVVENLLTIPLNLTASAAVAAALSGRPAIIHHHDPPWHRPHFAHVTELPADDPSWRHVTINRRLHAEFVERGLPSTVIYNCFAPPERRTAKQLVRLRDETRRQLGVGQNELLVAHPVRAIERKNIPAAIRLTEGLGATYWLLGPAEEGYDNHLSELFDATDCRVIHQSLTDTDAIYAAADHVAFPSTWEGFGNPPLEAALRRRTVTVGRYPVSDELRDLGFEWFETDDIEGPSLVLRDSESAAVRAMLDRNELIAREHFSLGRLRDSLRGLLDETGWLQ